MSRYQIKHVDLDSNAYLTGCGGMMRRLYERRKNTWIKTDMVQCDQCGAVYILSSLHWPHGAERIRDGDKDKMRGGKNE